MGLPVGETVGLCPSSAQSPVHASSFHEGESVGDNEGLWPSSVHPSFFQASSFQEGDSVGSNVLCLEKRLSYDVLKAGKIKKSTRCEHHIDLNALTCKIYKILTDYVHHQPIDLPSKHHPSTRENRLGKVKARVFYGRHLPSRLYPRRHSSSLYQLESMTVTKRVTYWVISLVKASALWYGHRQPSHPFPRHHSSRLYQ